MHLQLHLRLTRLLAFKQALVFRQVLKAKAKSKGKLALNLRRKCVSFANYFNKNNHQVHVKDRGREKKK